MWRKARYGKKSDGDWPTWVKSEPSVLSLFTTMQTFASDDFDDVAKIWGIDPRPNGGTHMNLQRTEIHVCV